MIRIFYHPLKIMQEFFQKYKKKSKSQWEKNINESIMDIRILRTRWNGKKNICICLCVCDEQTKQTNKYQMNKHSKLE